MGQESAFPAKQGQPPFGCGVFTPRPGSVPGDLESSQSLKNISYSYVGYSMVKTAGTARQAGAETDVTAAMVEAGVEVFLDWHPDTGIGDALDRLIVTEIFLAMAKAGSSKLEPDPLAPSSNF